MTQLFSGNLSAKDFLKVIFKEMRVGTLVSLVLVAINFLRILVVDNVSLAVNLTVSLTLFLTIVISNIIGGLLPLLADKLNIDPTVMAGPLITTIVDTGVLLIYFEVASLLLGL